VLVLLIPDAVVLFIDSQFTVIKPLECLEHNLIRSLSPRSHSLESYLSD
jgi:tetrahydromethanopterin S-methyltransferase subunit B